jgi:glucokinase
VAGGFGVGVDLGATRLRVCVGTEGKILRKETKTMTITKDVDAYVSQIVGTLKSFLGETEIRGICVATPGPLDLKRGMIVHTANLPYPEVPIVGALSDSFPTEVYLVNDANSASIGEWKLGAGRGRSNVFYLTMSTGIGGGAVVDGRLLLGKEGNAAEVGHTTIDSSGRLTCGCGRRGHWEAYCSGRGIPSLAALMAEELSSSGRGPGGAGLPQTAARVFDQAGEGNPFAKDVVSEVGRLNAIGVANVIDAFDPEILTIGGGVALHNQDLILKPIRDQVGEYAINAPPEILITPLGDDAGLLGALCVSFEPRLIGK